MSTVEARKHFLIVYKSVWVRADEPPAAAVSWSRAPAACGRFPAVSPDIVSAAPPHCDWSSSLLSCCTRRKICSYTSQITPVVTNHIHRSAHRVKAGNWTGPFTLILTPRGNSESEINLNLYFLVCVRKPKALSPTGLELNQSFFLCDNSANHQASDRVRDIKESQMMI